MQTGTLYNTTTVLPVMESFYTIQGEGYHQGRAAYFIRLAGCDVGCVWCDVKDSWESDKHPKFSIEQIVGEARKHPGRLAVVTGGEPLMHDCSFLTEELHDAGFTINIETSGSYPVTGKWDWICLSPKKFKAPLPGILPIANELKIVIYNKSDFNWAEQYASQVAPHCKLYLQPEWSRSEIVTPLIIDYILKNPKWEYSLQIHKYIHVP
jgi:7-carboxy-7-deazaguanine synthase